MDNLTHIDEKGKMKMVDITSKQPTVRRAVARGKIWMSEKAYLAVKNNTLEKGEALSTARLAGIMAAKKTSELIPLCHPLKITKVTVDFHLNDNEKSIEVESRVKGFDATGMEMEALTSASVALLTIYDMAKAIDKSMLIGDVRLVYKSGGKSGSFIREGEEVEENW
ncbi:MAG: cyclic pyranopterin monophosphate synthase MoaC [Actinobacteria bacterium]|nr:cyclic pyranopterin monophosphate synthase MoaC [Actinomycetota bacterium]